MAPKRIASQWLSKTRPAGSGGPAAKKNKTIPIPPETSEEACRKQSLVEEITKSLMTSVCPGVEYVSRDGHGAVNAGPEDKSKDDKDWETLEEMFSADQTLDEYAAATTGTDGGAPSSSVATPSSLSSSGQEPHMPKVSLGQTARHVLLQAEARSTIRQLRKQLSEPKEQGPQTHGSWGIDGVRPSIQIHGPNTQPMLEIKDGAQIIDHESQIYLFNLLRGQSII